MTNLKSVKTKSRKRVGRGISAGGGKTAGRGTKGQKSRAGHNIPKRFEGGQTPLSMRLPKLPGFKSHHKKATVLSLDLLSKTYKDGEIVSLATLTEKKLIAANDKRVKILNNGKLTIKISLSPEIKTSESIQKLFPALAEPKRIEKAEKPVETKEVEKPKKTAAKPATKTVKKSTKTQTAIKK